MGFRAEVIRLRQENTTLYILLYPVLVGIVLLRILTHDIVSGPSQRLQEGVPIVAFALYKHLMTATPYSIYCFNKSAFALFFAETLAFSYWFIIPRRKPVVLLPYIAIKAILIVMPFVLLSPVYRLPFWVLAAVLTAAEIFVGCM